MSKYGDLLDTYLHIGRFTQTSMYGDDSNAFIVGLDFDGTITKRKDCLMSFEYDEREPHKVGAPFEIRPQMVRFIEVLNLIGAVPFIFTSRSSEKLLSEMEDSLKEAGVMPNMYTMNIEKYWNLSMPVTAATYKPVYHILFDDANAGVPVMGRDTDPDDLYDQWLGAGLTDLFYNRLAIKKLVTISIVNHIIDYILYGVYVDDKEMLMYSCNCIKNYIMAIYQARRIDRGEAD